MGLRVFTCTFKWLCLCVWYMVDEVGDEPHASAELRHAALFEGEGKVCGCMIVTARVHSHSVDPAFLRPQAVPHLPSFLAARSSCHCQCIGPASDRVAAALEVPFCLASFSKRCLYPLS